MGELKVEDRSIVTPGETIASGMDYLPGDGTYRLGEEIKSALLGLANVKGRLMKVIPLSGRYMPKRRDIVIGVVNNIQFSHWNIDINGAYGAVLPIKEASHRFIDTRRTDMSEHFAIGDVVLAEISDVDGRMNVNITMRGPGLQKLRDGRLIDVAPSKVPRIIGKGGSMIRMIKDAGECNIIVGQNGRIWLKGKTQENENDVIHIIRKIEAESHTRGLTDRIRDELGIVEEVPHTHDDAKETLEQEMASVEETVAHEKTLVEEVTESE